MKRISLDENLIIEKYKTKQYTYADLGREFGVNKDVISRLLKRNNIGKLHDHNSLKRKYHLNEDYFNIIDSSEKAYYLGLITADGCIKNNNLIQLDLCEKDLHILERLNILLETEKPLQFRPAATKNHNNAYRLIISSQKMAELFISIGCTKRKSFTLNFPKEGVVPDELIKDYIRGFWMGNGTVSVYISKTKRKRVEICLSVVSTVMFCEKLAEIFKSEINVNSSIQNVNNRKTSIRRLIINGNIQCMRLLDWLYKDTTICQDRKFINYLQIKRLFENGSLYDYKK